MNSIQNYGITSQSTNFKGGVKQRARRLMDYPLVKTVIKENPSEQPGKILELVKTKVKEIVAQNKELQAGRMSKEEACNRALYLMA